MNRIIFALSLLIWHLAYGTFSWSPIEEFASPGVVYHEMVVNSKGDSCAIWSRTTENGYLVESSYKPYQKDWKSPLLLTDNLSKKYREPRIFVNPLDKIHAFWEERCENGSNSLKTAAWDPSEEWSSPVAIATDDCRFIQIVMDQLGNVHISWLEGPKNNKVIKSKTGRFR